MARSDHYACGAAELPDGKGKEWYRDDFRMKIYLDPVPCKYGCRFLGEFFGKIAAVIADDNAVLLRFRALGKKMRRDCRTQPAHDVFVHSVCTGADDPPDPAVRNQALYRIGL